MIQAPNLADVLTDVWGTKVDIGPPQIRYGGAVGLTDNPSALQRWLVAGPEVTALIKDFEDAHQLMGRRHEVIHHVQTANVQNAFRKDVCSLGNVMEELGNPFEEESEDLFVLNTKRLQSRLLRRHRR